MSNDAITGDLMPNVQTEDTGLEQKSSLSRGSDQSCSEPLLPKYNYQMERVLVVEDDRAVQRALKRLFEAKGYGVDVAGSGTAALETFHNAPPSAVVLDLRLPGASGKEVCRQIKSKIPSLPVIVLSATTDVVDKVLLLELAQTITLPSHLVRESCWRECRRRYGAPRGAGPCLMCLSSAMFQWILPKWSFGGQASPSPLPRRNSRS